MLFSPAKLSVYLLLIRTLIILFRLVLSFAPVGNVMIAEHFAMSPMPEQIVSSDCAFSIEPPNSSEDSATARSRRIEGLIIGCGELDSLCVPDDLLTVEASRWPVYTQLYPS